jgi:hypothetical protein
MPRTALKTAAILLVILVTGSVLTHWRERAAVATLSRPGCHASFRSGSPAPSWFSRSVNRIGVTWFDHVVEGTIDNYSFNSTDAEALKSLSYLTTLHMGEFWIDGPERASQLQSAASIAGLQNLLFLELSGISFNSDSTLRIHRCPKLNYLALEDVQANTTEITGLPLLALLDIKRTHPGRWGARKMQIDELPNLRELTIFRDDGLVDHGTFRLKNLPALETIDVRQVPINSVDFSGLPNLTQLEIRTTKFNDEGVISLRGLRGLVVLRLVICDITDAGLDRLDDLPALELIDVRLTAVTANGLAKLGRFPGLRTIVTSLALSPDQLQELQRALPGVIIIVQVFTDETFDELNDRLERLNR